jgi:hypothetical protein
VRKEGGAALAKPRSSLKNKDGGQATAGPAIGPAPISARSGFAASASLLPPTIFICNHNGPCASLPTPN